MIIRLLTFIVLFKSVFNDQLNDLNFNQQTLYLDSNNYILICQPIKKVNLNKLNGQFIDQNSNFLSSNKSLSSFSSENQTANVRSSIELLPNSAMKLVLNNNEAESINGQLSADKNKLINDDKTNHEQTTLTQQLNDQQLNDQQLNDQQLNLNQPENEETTTPFNFNFKEENVTEINDQSNLLKNDKVWPINKVRELDFESLKTVSPTGKDKNTDAKQLRGLNVGNSNLLNSITGQFPSIANQLPSKLTGFINGKGENHPDSKLSLVEDDKLFSSSFKQQSNEINQQKSQEKAPNDSSESYNKLIDKPVLAINLTDSSEKQSNNDHKQTIVSNNQTQSNPLTSTTQAPSTSLATLSPELIEQNKIFEEYFPPEQRNTPLIRLMLDSMKEKLGLHKKVIPEHQLQAELANLKAHLVTSTPGAISNPKLLSQSIPSASLPVANQHSTPLPILSTADYSTLNGSPKYISYEAYKKEQDKKEDQIKDKIKNTYLDNEQNSEENKKISADNLVNELKGNKHISYDDYKKEHDKYLKEHEEKEEKLKEKIKTEYLENEQVNNYANDKLKGNVNGPVEVAALDVKLPSKSKLDYVENDKPEFRTDNLRLGQLSPFNRIPALSRYSKVVSSVSKGFSSLYPGNDGYTGAKNVYPIYGYYRS